METDAGRQSMDGDGSHQAPVATEGNSVHDGLRNALGACIVGAALTLDVEMQLMRLGRLIKVLIHRPPGVLNADAQQKDLVAVHAVSLVWKLPLSMAQ